MNGGRLVVSELASGSVFMITATSTQTISSAKVQVRAIVAALIAILFLSGCGVAVFTKSEVAADPVGGARSVQGVRTRVEFVPDYAMEKLTNQMLYLWSPVADCVKTGDAVGLSYSVSGDAPNLQLGS